MDAGAFGIEDARVQLRILASGGAVNNDAPKVAHAFDALRHVLTAQHFEDCIDAFAAGQIFDGFRVIALFVVDAVLES